MTMTLEEIDAIRVLLKEVAHAVSRVTDARRSRELRLSVSVYAAAIERWRYHRPTDAQRAALLDCLRDMVRRARREQPTVPPPPAS